MLLWNMRLRSLLTLEHYLLEVGADLVLKELEGEGRNRAKALQPAFEYLLSTASRSG